MTATAQTIQDRLNKIADEKCKRDIEGAVGTLKQLCARHHVEMRIDQLNVLYLHQMFAKLVETFVETARDEYRQQETDEFMGQFSQLRNQLEEMRDEMA